MNIVLAALLITLAFAKAADAREAPFLIGNYDDAVLQSYHHGRGVTALPRSSQGTRFIGPPRNIGATTKSAIKERRGGYGPTVTEFELRTGK